MRLNLNENQKQALELAQKELVVVYGETLESNLADLEKLVEEFKGLSSSFDDEFFKMEAKKINEFEKSLLGLTITILGADLKAAKHRIMGEAYTDEVLMEVSAKYEVFEEFKKKTRPDMKKYIEETEKQEKQMFSETKTEEDTKLVDDRLNEFVLESDGESGQKSERFEVSESLLNKENKTQRNEYNHVNYDKSVVSSFLSEYTDVPKIVNDGDEALDAKTRAELSRLRKIEACEEENLHATKTRTKKDQESFKKMEQKYKLSSFGILQDDLFNDLDMFITGSVSKKKKLPKKRRRKKNRY